VFCAHDCHHVRTSVRTVVVHGSARGGWEDSGFVADAVSAAAGPLRRFVRTCERSASHYCSLLHSRTAMLRHDAV
jgi:hypothetical protein